jgi:4,5-DOPA dioxygenase extradiol
VLRNRRAGFDQSARELMQRAPADAPSLAAHPDFRLASPTPDHFIPLLVLAGLAGAAKKPAEVLVDGYSYGSISMTCFTLDLHCPEAAKAGKGASAPMPEGVPADDSNL